MLFGSGDAASADAPVLLLPPAAAGKALIAGGAQARSAAVARLASQRSRGAEADASFLLAQAAYRFATGKHAFEREAGEASSLAASSPSSVPLALAAPRLDRDLAALVDKALADPNAAPLGEWRRVLGAAYDAGLDSRARPGARGRAHEAQPGGGSPGRARRRQADFLRRRGGLLIVAAVVIVIVALFVGELAQAQRDKPDFSALTPRELVARYYQAIDRIDLDSLEACGEKKAIKGDDDMLIEPRRTHPDEDRLRGQEPAGSGGGLGRRRRADARPDGLPLRHSRPLDRRRRAAARRDGRPARTRAFRATTPCGPSRGRTPSRPNRLRCRPSRVARTFSR